MMRRRTILSFLLLVLAAYPAFIRTNKVSKPLGASRPAADVAARPAAVTARAAVVDKWLRGMTLRDKVAQLLMIASYGELPSSRSAAYSEFVRAVRDLKVGGVIVVNRVVDGSVRHAEPHAMASFLNRMQRLAKTPLLVGADFERGASMRVSGTVKYPHLMAYGAADDLALTRALGAATAREARALGVHWIFAPVADVNSNPENPIINIRSFAGNAQVVGRHVAAFIEGAHSDPKNPVLVTAKHFPGHGDTSVDSHMRLARLDADRSQIDSTELVPFRAAIAAGVDAVMTAHMAVPAIEPADIPATVSKRVLTGLLRQDLGFRRLIVTDAMDMKGLAAQIPGPEAGIRALLAGADMLLMPPDPAGVIDAAVAAVRHGRLTEKRIDESVARVLAAKTRVALARNRLVDLESITDTIESPELQQHAQAVADRAVTLVRNEQGTVPLRNPDRACVFILAEGRASQQGSRLADELAARAKAIAVTVLYPQTSRAEIDQHVSKASRCEAVVVAAFVTVGAYRGNVALAGSHPALVESLVAGSSPVVLVALGSPYLLRSYPNVASYMATFSPSETSEIAAAKALLGAIEIRGRLPVSIPGVADVAR
jgi:beta-N-acetylhexosaminidase